MRKIGVLAAALTLFVAYVPGASAWGPQGHRTVGAIADRLLTPAARAEVATLLAADLDKFDNPSGRSTLESVAVWADEIRGTPADRPRWHYDDVPVCGSAPRDSYCAGGECNSAQLERLTLVLADRHAELRARNEALKWIVHLVGDIHQPLHAADNGDQGGNRVRVALEGVHTRGRLSLHRAWDSELVTLALKTRSHQQPPRDIDALAREAGKLTAEAGQGTPSEWASQSNHLARNVAYQYPGFACGSVPAGVVVLDRDYQREAEAIVRERLLLAGGRLANLLNETLVTR
ncbi:MAG TPA: S1/P1 nuclease [Steroidobacteraceae bacterium]|nr:S1/P1 nuclease [Steroidobacteraceae bacterium]